VSNSALTELIEWEGQEYFKLNVQLKKLLAEIPDEAAQKSVMAAALSNPLRWYCPNGKQEELIKTVVNRLGRADTPTILFSAANGVGKTNSVLNIVANIVYQPQNGWFLYDCFRYWDKPKICWYITTKTGLTDVVIPEIKRLFPAGTYQLDKMGTALERAIHFENGWEWRFFTMDVDPEQMESASVGLVIIDEPAPEPIWKAVKSRGRMGMLTLLPMTPLDVEPYILDEVEKNKDTDLYARVTARLYDACEERGVRGHLKARIVDEMVKKYPADERIARVEGDFMYFKEKIWINLDSSKHFVEPDEYPISEKDDYFIQVVDPHDGRPSASIYAAIQKIEHSDEYSALIAEGKAFQQYRKIIFGETPIDKSTPFWEIRRNDVILEDEPAMWAEYEDSLGLIMVHRRIIDKRFAFQTRLSYNIAKTYADAGRKLDPARHGNKRFSYTPSYDLRSTDAKSEISYGHSMVMKALDPLEDGKPGLVVWDTCYHTRNGMEHYLRRRLNKASDSNIAVGDSKIIEKYKDFNDLLRYLCCDNVSKTAVQQKEEKRRPQTMAQNGTKSVYSVMGSFMKKAR